MQSANLSGPLKGLRPHQALLGPTQASGLAGGFDFARVQARGGGTGKESSPGFWNRSLGSYMAYFLYRYGTYWYMRTKWHTLPRRMNT